MAIKSCASWPGVLAMILLVAAGSLLVASMLTVRFSANSTDESCETIPNPNATCLNMFLREYYFRPGPTKPGETDKFVRGPKGSRCLYSMAVTPCPQSVNGTQLISCYCPSQYTVPFRFFGPPFESRPP